MTSDNSPLSKLGALHEKYKRLEDGASFSDVGWEDATFDSFPLILAMQGVIELVADAPSVYRAMGQMSLLNYGDGGKEMWEKQEAKSRLIEAALATLKRVVGGEPSADS